MAIYSGQEALPPPKEKNTVVMWLKSNLFSTWYNTIFTGLLLILLVPVIWDIALWAFIDANWFGARREDCVKDGACWVFITQRFGQLIYGFYPMEWRWRVDIVFALLTVLIVFLVVPQTSKRTKQYLGLFTIFIFPLVSYGLIYGGFWGLPRVETYQWGGLMLTLVLAFTGILVALPLGIILAFGRRSNLPVISRLAVVYIEFWRAVPLITVLFMASVMLPLFVDSHVSLDKLVRALVGIIMFQAAYIAEVVRGGLQAIPRGQYEAAKSLGLTYWQSMGLIILPQALKITIPSLVNTFIALFKDTSLVLIIGLFDLLAIGQSALSDPLWLGYSVEMYVFVGFVFWVFCFGMSRYSIYLEGRLHTGH